MKRAQGKEIGLLVVVVSLVSLTGCAGKMKLMDARLDAAHKRLDALSDDIKTYDEQGRDRSAEHDLAIKKLERDLTSRFSGEIKAVDAASRRRSSDNKAAMREMEENLTSKFTGQIEAVDAAGRERSAGHEAALRALDESLTARLVAQRQAFEEERENLRKSLHVIKAELDKANERDAKMQLRLGQMASKEDLERLVKDLHKRHADTQQVLEGIAKSSGQAVQVSTEMRTAMQRLIEAHAIFVKGGEDLIAALEAESNGEESQASASVYLGILYEQRKAQKRMLQEMQALLSQAACDLQKSCDTPADCESENEAGDSDS